MAAFGLRTLSRRTQGGIGLKYNGSIQIILALRSGMLLLLCGSSSGELCARCCCGVIHQSLIERRPHVASLAVPAATASFLCA